MQHHAHDAVDAEPGVPEATAAASALVVGLLWTAVGHRRIRLFNRVERDQRSEAASVH
jgi:hypothetical protein